MATAIMEFLPWIPLEFYMLMRSIISVVSIFFIAKILKLIWDALPIA